MQNYPLLCCCHVMYKLLYPSIRVRTVPPVSVRVRSGLWLVLVLVLRCSNAIAHTVLNVPDLHSLACMAIISQVKTNTA